MVSQIRKKQHSKRLMAINNSEASKVGIQLTLGYYRAQKNQKQSC